MSGPYESCIVQSFPTPTEASYQGEGGPSQRGPGGQGWYGAAAAEGEAVAVSLGCYLLASLDLLPPPALPVTPIDLVLNRPLRWLCDTPQSLLLLT